MAEPRLIEILRTLRAHDVELIVVGGMAAVIGGAPVVTRDVDVLRRRSPENVQRCLAALTELDAVFRGDSRRLRPQASHLEGPGHLLLETRYGVLDVLGTIEDATTYEDVLADRRARARSRCRAMARRKAVHRRLRARRSALRRACVSPQRQSSRSSRPRASRRWSRPSPFPTSTLSRRGVSRSR